MNTPRTDEAEDKTRYWYENMREAGDPPFDSAQFDLPRQLERELAEAKAELEELNAWKKGMRGVEEFYSIREKLSEMIQFRDLLANKEMELLKQLTAHKAALEKCEKALFATWADLDHLNHWMPTPCRELYMEAISEIAKLKKPK